VISKTSGAFDPADVAKVVEAIQLKNTDADSQFGIRTATITYTDINGSESEVPMVLPVTLAKSAFNASSASNINLSFASFKPAPPNTTLMVLISISVIFLKC
jgi:hypothetical protein